MLVNNKSGKSHRREQPLSAPHTVEGFARHGVAEVRRNAQMAPPVAILDPRRDTLDRNLPRMSGDSREVSRLREALQIAPGPEDHRQLAPIRPTQPLLAPPTQTSPRPGLFHPQSNAWHTR